MAKTKKKVISNIILNHISNNIKEYIIVSLCFLIGIFMGVMFINNSDETKREEITGYISNYIEEVKENDIVTSENLQINIKENIFLGLTLWFFGTTIIGIPIVLGIIAFRGFCIGYTISACTLTLGLSKGILFIALSIIFQNIILIPSILALGVSGIKLYKSIMKDKRKENVKIEVIRHTIFSLIILLLMLVSSVFEIQISGGMLEKFINYF